MKINRWWVGGADEVFWLEVSARGADLGIDLNAPATDERGERPHWSYALIDEVAEGEVVVHYDRDAHAIVAWSIAVGSPWADTVVWGARGTSARAQNIQPHERPGRRLSLNGPFLLAQPLSLDRIRKMKPQLERMRVPSGYFPFELGRFRPPRPLQGYLFKLPAAFVDLFPELSEVPRIREKPSARLPARRGRGETKPERRRKAFVPRNERTRSKKAEPWTRDPSEVDRALSSHARIERLVAEAAAEKGWEPLTMGDRDPPFDLVLVRPSDGREIVVEAKSTTLVNEEKQLRLALGQVLRYRQVLRDDGRHVETMIAVEEEVHPSWVELCGELGVYLVWPETVGATLTDLT